MKAMGNLPKMKSAGMYIVYGEGKLIDLSYENIKKLSEMYWNDPTLISDEIKHHEVFKTCTVCPFRGQNIFCSAIKPLLPFVENVDSFKSFDEVSVFYRFKDGSLLGKSTDMQTALQYITDMSIFDYCEDMKRYSRYFKGIYPLQTMEDNVRQVVHNIYFCSSGNIERTKRNIRNFHHGVDVTSRNCIKRMNLMCKNDALSNAYVKTHMLAEFIKSQADKLE